MRLLVLPLLALLLIALTGTVLAQSWQHPRGHKERRPFNPNPHNFDYLNSSVYLDELNSGRLDKQLIENGLKFATHHYRKYTFGLSSASELLDNNQDLLYLRSARTGCPAGFIHELIRLINNRRARHQAPPLHLNKTLNVQAQDIANDRDIDGISESFRDGLSTTNQNFGATFANSGNSWEVSLTTGEVIRSFYQELAHFHSYGLANPKAADQPNSKQFTNLVWKSTRQVGVACTTFQNVEEKNKNSVVSVVRVALSFPWAEHKGNFADNVLPPNDIQWKDWKVVEKKDEEIVIN